MYHIINICDARVSAFIAIRTEHLTFRRKNMKYCSHCGKEVADDAFVCPGCGCKIGGKSESSLSGMSIAGFVLAFLMPVIGLILSIVAHNGAKRDDDERSARFSKAGIIISACIIALYVIIVVICVSCTAAIVTSYPYYY